MAFAALQACSLASCVRHGFERPQAAATLFGEKVMTRYDIFLSCASTVNPAMFAKSCFDATPRPAPGTPHALHHLCILPTILWILCDHQVTTPHAQATSHVRSSRLELQLPRRWRWSPVSGGACGQELYGTLWNSMELYGTLWNSLELYGTLWNSLELYGTLWNSMELYGTLRNSQLCSMHSKHLSAKIWTLSPKLEAFTNFTFI